MLSQVRRYTLISLFLIGVCVTTYAEGKTRTPLYLQPIGNLEKEVDLKQIEDALKIFLGIQVEILPAVAPPKDAYYVPRKRFRAEILLDFLRTRMPNKNGFILGITSSDISTTKGKIYDWGVLGLGDLDGQACVISFFRCKMKSKSIAHAKVRLAKVAVHEMGHVLGLDHCPNRGCLMEDAMGKVTTTDREKDFCPTCRLNLKQNGYQLPRVEKFPW